MENQYSMRSPAVKRLMREAQELRQPSEEYYAQPLEDNLFEWHFTVRGPPDTDFDNGIYHGRIILPPEYPMKPPSIILLTPNGRFEVNKKICLSISGYHPESWQPSWSIRTALIAMIGFMPTSGNGAIGSLDYTPEERQILAKKSHTWKCTVCGSVNDLLLKRTKSSRSNNELLDRNHFEETNGHVLSTEAQISSRPELPFSRLAASPVPIPLPDHNMGDIAHFPAGVGLDNAPPTLGPQDDPPQIESPVNQTQNLRLRRSEVSTTESIRRNASDVANPGHNYCFYVLKLILIVAIVLLALRRLYFL